MGGLFLATAPASAESTDLPLQRQINDHNETLSSDGEASLQAALIALDEEDGIDLYVLTVDTTDGMAIGDFADSVADANGLTRTQPLFVMATTDDTYYLSVTNDFPLDDQELSVVTDAAESPFATRDYAGAAEAVAAALQKQVSSGSGGAVVGGLVVLGALGVGGAALVNRRKPKYPPQQGPWPTDPGGVPTVPLEQLRRDVSRMLVGVDEDVRGADRELAFAQAEFGDAAVARFAAALDQAKHSLQAAFRVRQQLDDDIPEDEPTQRRMLAEIADRCGQARHTLAAQAAEFAALRDVSGRAATLVPALHTRLDTLERDLPDVQRAIDDLSLTYSPAAAAPVTQVPTEVGRRIQTARNALAGGAQGRPTVNATGAAGGAIDTPPRVQAQQAAGGSAVAIRAAEAAVIEAETLVAGVARLVEQTGQAGAQLTAAVAAIEADLAALADLAPQPALTQAVGQARAAVQYAGSAGPGDPLGALNRVTQADSALDQVVAGAREHQARAAAAGERLQRLLIVAQASLDQANDLIGGNRNRVGAQARTQAGEAAQLLGEARALAGTDPVQALPKAERANALAQSAVSAAQQDIASAGRGGYGGGYGQPSWGNNSWGNGGWIGGGMGSIFGDGWSTGGSWGGSRGGSWGGSGGGSATRRSSSGATRRSSSGGGGSRGGGGGGGGRRGSGRR